MVVQTSRSFERFSYLLYKELQPWAPGLHLAHQLLCSIFKKCAPSTILPISMSFQLSSMCHVSPSWVFTRLSSSLLFAATIFQDTFPHQYRFTSRTVFINSSLSPPQSQFSRGDFPVLHLQSSSLHPPGPHRTFSALELLYNLHI